MSKVASDPAFPSSHVLGKNSFGNDVHKNFDGMTLRDYFAAKSMQAYIFPEMLHGANTEEEIANEYRNIAAFAYRMADAMLAERAK